MRDVILLVRGENGSDIIRPNSDSYSNFSDSDSWIRIICGYEYGYGYEFGFNFGSEYGYGFG